MKKAILSTLCLLFIVVICFSCKKKDTGNCYCHYYSGDKKNYDLSSFSKSKQADSCAQLDQLASGFGGDCDLE